MFQFFTSSVGKKYIMAVTGIMLVLFAIGHMLGNLQIYIGSEALNKYAHTLQSLGAVLWLIRAGLLTIFVIHIVTGVSLYLQNKKARPVGYINPDTVKATIPSRTMIISGVVLLAFVVYHILHFTLHVTDPALVNLTTTEGHFNVYQMVILGFSNIPASLIYFASMILLAFHLYHGATSWFQSLGINNNKYNCLIKIIGPLLAFVLFIGNSSIPASILMKWIK